MLSKHEALPSTVWTQLRSVIPADRRQRAAAGTGYGALYTCAATAVPGLQNKIQTDEEGGICKENKTKF